ncbi:DUF998 domain-containing protein [Gordonia sputi]|uniref:DUF998 domain-containing protein n=1 Tax=Gordonia sputi NBRC 100414 TaxID=1089453 RepID=H5U6Q7_9ACTN|nr:DUF998 domain-containing protein [Gordonia sputi]NKY94727.1 DUF998 domain-containing protein [Gordonia sputi]GAB41415.1 hypothetical protein GOSPT_129_00630 [Gordonia sputi NBRC 100414]
MPSLSTTRRITAGILIALAGICYSSWVLEFFWSSPLDPLNSFLSELDAAHRPHRAVYETGDILTAIFAVSSALILFLPRPIVSGVYARIAVISFGVFGAATLADALAPVDCIPGVDKDCPYEPSGLLPQLHHIHALTSTIAVFAIFITMIAGVVAAYRQRPRIWPLLRTAGLGVLVVVAVTTAWMLIADNLHGDYYLGLAQRIQVGGMSVWLILWGFAVCAQRTRSQASAAPSTPAQVSSTS